MKFSLLIALLACSVSCIGPKHDEPPVNYWAKDQALHKANVGKAKSAERLDTALHGNN